MSDAASFGLVILNWNNASDTLECLNDLAACDPRPERIIVVDNASADDSVHRIQSWWASREDLPRDWLTVIGAGSNRGFAGGSNIGIRHLLGKSSVTHIVLLNNDTLIPPDFFAKLRTALAGANGPGILGPTIREYPAKEKIWYAGGREHFYRGLVQHEVELPGDSRPAPTDFVTGCAMIVARQVLEQVGDLSEHYYPAYFEDGDLCHRAMRGGFTVMYAPEPVIYHKVGSTVRAAGPSLQLTYTKNRLRVIYVRRNYRGLNKAVALTYLAVTKPARTIVEALKGHPGYAWQVLRGTVSGFLARGIA
ncbi:MAG TPA: glycosyltransferase family 2 protein [Gemmatimonadaceae bacterium]